MKKIPELFALCFASALGLTLLSGMLSLWLAMQEHLGDRAGLLFDVFKDTWTMGSETIFHLLGGPLLG